MDQIQNQTQTQSQTLPLWLNPAHAKHMVRGNFMTLSIRPRSIEQGEWVAHQVAEHYRILWSFVRVVHEKEAGGNSICNPVSCPKMSAGRSVLYNWLNVDQEPVELPAYECMKLLQQWISAKIEDNAVFPTDLSGVSSAYSSQHGTEMRQSRSVEKWLGIFSGFPERFAATCKVIFRQMFRVYAHLYWSHFIDPFYHLDLEKHLNSCFGHFLLTATGLNMLQCHELEPMQDLVNLWAVDGTFPMDSNAYKFADLERGHFLQSRHY